MVDLRICLIASLAACSAQDENKVTAPPQPSPVQPRPAPDAPNTEPTVTASFASVQMLGDCPDPPTAAPAVVPVQAPSPAPGSLTPPKPYPPASTVARPARQAPSSPIPGGAVHHYVHPCMQSTVQFSFENEGPGDIRVSLSEVRFLSAAGESFGAIATRGPTHWRDNGYHVWDETLAAFTELAASYKLSMPNWAEVEKSQGSTSYGPMYLLEADVSLGAVVQTVRSAPFSRQRPMVPPT